MRKVKHRGTEQESEPQPAPNSTGTADGAPFGGAKEGGPKRPKRRRHWRTLGLGLIVLGVLLGIGRAMLPSLLRNYVNQTLDRSFLYTGQIGEVQIHLWRGAYSIHDVRISKRTGDVPVPFFDAQRLDFAIQWDALLHRRLVGRVLIDQPELNFVDAPSDSEDQTGAGGPWLQMVRNLFPFTINRAVIENGSVHFRVYHTAAPVDVYLSEIEGSIDNLTNIRNETTPLVAKVQAKGRAMDQARFDLNMTLDPFSYRPTFRLAARLIGLDVTTINDLALTYGKFDFQHGWFDFVVEVDAKEGRLSGYAKPLFRNLQVFGLSDDIQVSNPLQFFWEALIGVTTTVFQNRPRDQFGTLIPFRGDLSGATTADILATVGNVLRNAFIRAYLPQLESGEDPGGFLQFEAPEFDESLTVGQVETNAASGQ